ncbi:hypothetical protein [Algoriphagus sp. AK58]|uniref:hypothetical protein n=1 Tax=Algoriphagus sp. AK58 TaxID=1406877 RepID=UPI00164F2FBF|nr:hypothetical protein [Algoriphagus sp. AK58]MBC6367557.1 hypothetical protein [Algoriphagus sp. AK58]
MEEIRFQNTYFGSSQGLFSNEQVRNRRRGAFLFLSPDNLLAFAVRGSNWRLDESSRQMDVESGKLTGFRILSEIPILPILKNYEL